MRRMTLLIVAVGALVPAASAAAQQPPAPDPAPAPTTSQPPPAPAAGTLRISLERAGGRRATVLTGARPRVRGSVTPYVAGQHVVVRVRRGGSRLLVRKLAIRPGPSGAGTFAMSLRAGRAGRLTVSASHRATAQQRTMVARPQRLDVLPRRVGPGSSLASVRALQARLARLGYVVGRRGAFDGRTARAVVALRKVTGLARTSAASPVVMRRLARGGGRFRVRFPNHGRHVEADLSRQVLVLVDGGRVKRIYPTSSGAPATPTIRGSFRVYRKDFGTNALGMVHAAYFRGGYAIHGFRSVPVFGASHGCLRVPVPDALSIFRWIGPGMRVDVYR